MAKEILLVACIICVVSQMSTHFTRRERARLANKKEGVAWHKDSHRAAWFQQNLVSTTETQAPQASPTNGSSDANLPKPSTESLSADALSTDTSPQNSLTMETPAESTPPESVELESTEAESTPVESIKAESTPSESEAESTPAGLTEAESAPTESTELQLTEAQSTETILIVSAKTCDTLNCLPPRCRCAGTDIPGGLSKSQTPQMILLTMDDGVTKENFQLYSELLDGVTNFNGCPIKATFFVSGDNSDYSLVKKLHETGHEIADHSVSHRFPIEWWGKNASYKDLEFEILTQMKTIRQSVGVTTRGWRNPFLESTENTFKVLAENEFLYDSSLGTFPGVRWWPYTLDHLPSLGCYMTNCPKNSYPGMWEIPLVTLLCDASNTTFATMLDECQNLNTEESVYDMLMRNFKLHYEGNKQPFPMFGHSFWFDSAAYRKNAVVRFMDYVRKLNDVYFVTAQEAIQWIQSPIGIDERPFSCNQ